MYIKSKFFILLLIIFIYSNIIDLYCNVNVDSILITTNKNLINLIENNEIEQINHISFYNRYFNETKNETRFDTLDIYLKGQLINIVNKDYKILMDDTICIILENNSKVIKFTKVKNRVNTLTEYFNLKNISIKNLINFIAISDKIKINFKNNLNTLVPKKNNEMSIIINKQCFIEQINYVYNNFEDKIFQEQQIFYKNSVQIINFKNAFDFIFEGNKIKKEYENFKIIK